MKSSVADHPHLVAEWHPTGNGPLSPEHVSVAGRELIWWRCPLGTDHEWQASPSNRHYRGSGCPFCRNLRVSAHNSLATVRPDLAAEWHPTRNGSLRPSDIVFGSNRKVFWRCALDPTHEWAAQVSWRSGPRATGCPYCAGRRVDSKNSLAAKAPHIAAQWHPIKNGDLTPADVTAGSSHKVWWRCPKDENHEWQATVSDRARFGCSVCAGRTATKTTSLAAVHPAIASEWHSEKNGPLHPEDVVPGSNRKVFWRCAKKGHEFEMPVNRRSAGRGCPVCAGRRIAADRTHTNSVAAEAPNLVAEWHPTKNGGLLPDQVRAGSCTRVWWKCPAGPDHEWEAAPRRRIKGGQGCPFCCSHRLSVTNSLATVRPDLAAVWHTTRNGSLTPRDVTAGSHREVWWQCARNPRHAWRMAVHSVRGCPYCSHRTTPPEDSLQKLMPHMARQWHPTKNGSLTPKDVVPGSNVRVWWKCPKGPDHEWQGVIHHRTRNNTRCPFCVGKRASRTNSLAARFPAVAAQWHPAGNAPLTAHDVLPSSPHPVWWLCPAGPDHQWQAPPMYRTRLAFGCPFCSGRRLSVTNCLAARDPRVAARWHPTKNAPLTPQHVFPWTIKRVWWRCERGHEWQAQVKSRVEKQGGCPICLIQHGRGPVARRKTRENVRLHSDYPNS